jgi:predicted dehydrogenase
MSKIFHRGDDVVVRFDRRKFLKKSAGVAAAAAAMRAFPAPSILAAPSPNSKLNIAGIGVGGRGAAHVQSSLSENLVAVCDVVEGAVNGALGQFEHFNKEHGQKRPQPQKFSDYRELFDKMHGQIDAVFVATPDHHHAPASLMAMKLGKHVYCEKPLTHSISEARQLTLAAREHKIATQMGNNGREGEGWRRLCEWIWAGAIGNVQEAHIWTDRAGTPKHPWWPQGGVRPAGADPISAGLNWNAWLGPAPERPYLNVYKDGKFKGKPVYQPFVWRGWWDFGTGALGDIGCHAMSGLFTALKIEYAESVELVKDSGDASAEMFPTSSIIRWDIPARAGMPPCKIFWYDGGYYPTREVCELPAGREFPENGAIFIGDKGKMTGEPRLMSAERAKDFKPPAPSIPRCESNHFNEWVTACKGGRPAFSNFDHGGPLTEMVLLGNLAVRAGVGKKVLWDGPNMKATNLPDLNRLVRNEYRPGWGM